jgi:hypothetical protein
VGFASVVDSREVEAELKILCYRQLIPRRLILWVGMVKGNTDAKMLGWLSFLVAG